MTPFFKMADKPEVQCLQAVSSTTTFSAVLTPFSVLKTKTTARYNPTMPGSKAVLKLPLHPTVILYIDKVHLCNSRRGPNRGKRSIGLYAEKYDI